MSKAYKAKLYVLNEEDLYKILNIKEDSTLDEISKAYKTIAKELHPDLNQSITPEEKSQAGKIFQKITSAFNILKDTEQKARYDAEKKLKSIREENLKKDIANNKKVKDNKIDDAKNEDGSISFTFKQMKFVDMDRIRIEKENNLKDKSEEKFIQAKNLLESKKYDEAADILKTIIEILPNQAKYHSYLGLAMDGKGWAGYAQAEFKVALHYDSNDEIAKKYYKPVETLSRVINKTTTEKDLTEKENISMLKETTTNLKEVLGRVRGLFGKK
ncbi:MAG: J domain-containing protein [Cyanobacteriota bacterium]